MFKLKMAATMAKLEEIAKNGHTYSLKNVPVADPGFGQGGGPRNFFRDFADVAKRSRGSE